jgi:hypothetical protein
VRNVAAIARVSERAARRLLSAAGWDMARALAAAVGSRSERGGRGGASSAGRRLRGASGPPRRMP